MPPKQKAMVGHCVIFFVTVILNTAGAFPVVLLNLVSAVATGLWAALGTWPLTRFSIRFGVGLSAGMSALVLFGVNFLAPDTMNALGGPSGLTAKIASNFGVFLVVTLITYAIAKKVKEQKPTVS